MHRRMLSWKVVTPMVGVVLATLYVIQQSGDEVTALPSAPGSAQVATPPSLTWPVVGATVQPDRNISAGSPDNVPARTAPGSPSAQFGNGPGTELSQPEGEGNEDVMHQALSATDPSARAIAISLLAGISAPDALYTLGHVLQDGDVNNRRAAVDSLRRLAYSNGDPDGQIRSLLLSATQDTDPSVATWAHEIIEGLNGTFEQ